MKIFCSYAYTGEDAAAVDARMRRIVDELAAAGHEAYCISFDEAAQHFTSPAQYMRRALARLPTCDAVFALMTSPRRSEGQLMEIGAALVLDKPIFLAQHNSASEKSYLQTVVNETHTWHTDQELITVIRSLRWREQDGKND